MKTRPAIVLAGVLFGWSSRDRQEQAKAVLETATTGGHRTETNEVPPDQRQRSPMAASIVRNQRTERHGALDHAIEYA
ncbi:hypothetical protein NKJ46_14515 [Mesorhizobium sp. M0166]|uniref:hypothetical protein n=1 Tax=Mesorhizobium sp. M0166 TaxID=2956902 RepID=UPI003334F690